MKKFVENIEEERVKQNLRQIDLCENTGISTSAYSKFIKNKNTSFENIIKIMQYLNMHAHVNALITKGKYLVNDELKNEKKIILEKECEKLLLKIKEF